MGRRGRQTLVVALTAFAVVMMEFGQIGCQAACLSASMGKLAKCPLSRGAQTPTAKRTCCSPEATQQRQHRNECPQCPVCKAPTRAITHSKLQVVQFPTIEYFPAAILSPLTLVESCHETCQDFDVIASLHPPAQIMNCVWRN